MAVTCRSHHLLVAAPGNKTSAEDVAVVPRFHCTKKLGLAVSEVPPDAHSAVIGAREQAGAVFTPANSVDASMVLFEELGDAQPAQEGRAAGGPQATSVLASAGDGSGINQIEEGPLASALVPRRRGDWRDGYGGGRRGGRGVLAGAVRRWEGGGEGRRGARRGGGRGGGASLHD